MQIGIASRRVGSHYLASFRLAKEEKKRRGRGREREKKKDLARSPEPRSIFLRAISSFTVDQPTLYARAFSPDGSIRRDAKENRNGILSVSFSPPSCPFCAPDRGSYPRRSARWGRIIHRPRARSHDHEERILTTVMWPGGSVPRPCPLLASILHPMYRRVDEMVNRRAVEEEGKGWRRTGHDRSRRRRKRET